ncbi:MAG: hypothetical protein ACQEP1_03310 [Nanobdellota archaeon]
MERMDKQYLYRLSRKFGTSRERYELPDAFREMSSMNGMSYVSGLSRFHLLDLEKDNEQLFMGPGPVYGGLIKIDSKWEDAIRKNYEGSFSDITSGFDFEGLRTENGDSLKDIKPDIFAKALYRVDDIGKLDKNFRDLVKTVDYQDFIVKENYIKFM